MFDLKALIQKIDEMVKASKDLKNTIEENTKAVKENTRALKESRK